MDKHYLSHIELFKKVLMGTLYEESSWEILYAHKSFFFSKVFSLQIIRNLIINFLNKKNIVLFKKRPFDLNARNEGRYGISIGYTMISKKRLDNIQFCFDEVINNKISGDFIEAGVWRGGSVIFMRFLLKINSIKDRNVWAADSFAGMPQPKNVDDGHDHSMFNHAKVSLEQVKSNFKKFDLLDDQVKFLKGWFSDSLPKAPIKSIAILRLDGDLYSSTMDSLNNLYHKVSKGGFIIVDEYYDWPECGKAVDDFRKKNSITSELNNIDWSAVYWIRD